MFRRSLTALALAATTQLASASVFTNFAPNGTDVTTLGASTVGGIVVLLTGTDGTQVLAQLAANTLFVGDSPNTALMTIGTQSGWGNAVTGVFAAGLSRASFRFSLFDGDNAAGNFDFGNNFLRVNGVEIGSWSTVVTQNTDGNGNVASGGNSTGFRNNTLDTGWFDVTDGNLLASMLAAIDLADSLKFELRDTDPGDQFYDFTQGINTSLITVGTGPVVAPPTTPPTKPPVAGVPEPGSLLLAGLALVGVAASRRQRR